MTYVSARGCPLSCAFCAVANQKIRSKSIPQLSRDVRTLVDLGYSKIAFEDNFFAHNRQRTRAVCGALAELQKDGLNFSWDCQTRVESMDRMETVGLMEEAGCEAVYLGVESLDEAALHFLGKTANPSGYLSRLIDRVIPMLLDTSIDCYINLQFGLPDETQEQIENSLRSMERLGEIAAQMGRIITVFPQLFVVYPGTGHFQCYLNRGVFREDIFESFTEWEAEQKPILSWLGETFAHGTGGLPPGVLHQEGLRNQTYNVDETAVARVVDTIARLKMLPGVTVFQYGSYLVKEGLDA